MESAGNVVDTAGSREQKGNVVDSVGRGPAVRRATIKDSSDTLLKESFLCRVFSGRVYF